MIYNNKMLIQRVYTNRVYFNKRDQLASTGPCSEAPATGVKLGRDAYAEALHPAKS
jgi:hypothetical protein